MLILNKLAAEHDAKIAILDSRTATLFIDPDLDTLSRYARHLRFGIDATLSPMLSPRFEAIPLSEHLPTTLHCAKMLSPTEHAQLSLPQHEDALFEALRALGEESRESPLLFPVRVYNLQSEESLASLRLRLRALLRAAVYGSLSLLFEGIYSEASAKQAFSVLKGVVKELSEESLEHNAHLPCGITAESFLLLHTLNTTLPIDYICLDWDRLVRSALPSVEEKAPTDEDRQAFLEMLHAYTNRLSLPICARTLHTPRIQPWPAEQHPPYKILSFFVPSEHILTWQEWLNKEK